MGSILCKGSAEIRLSLFTAGFFKVKLEGDDGSRAPNLWSNFSLRMMSAINR